MKVGVENDVSRDVEIVISHEADGQCRIVVLLFSFTEITIEVGFTQVEMSRDDFYDEKV